MVQYEVETPAEYLRSLDDDWRKQTLLELRDVIRTAAPTVEEGIQYKMLSYSDERGVIMHLNAQRQYVALYVGDTTKIDAEGELLEGLNCGKGCIRFTKSKRVADTRIDEFLARTIQLWQEGADIGC